MIKGLLMPHEKYDVAIIGAGLIGSAAALALSQAGLKVALIDRTDLSKNLTAHYDGRTLAIAYGSKLILAQWQIWPLIAPGATPIAEIRVSSPRPGCYIDYDAYQVADHPMGYIVEINKLRLALFDQLRQTAQINLYMPNTFTHIEQTPASVIIHLNDGKSIEACMAIGADGHHSAVRQALGIRAKIWSYKQMAIVGTVTHQKPHTNVAFEHFRADGPLALLPMQGNCSSLVWTMPIPKAQAYMALDESLFNEELQRCFGSSLGQLTIQGKRWAYALEGLYCSQWYRGRISLMGDACHVIHPVAGQGFNLGLRDAQVLVTKLIDADSRQYDLGAAALLKAYQRQRRWDSLTMTAMTDGLVRLFSNDSTLLGYMRTTGLRLTNHLPVIKNILTRHAMGLPFKGLKKFL